MYKTLVNYSVQQTMTQGSNSSAIAQPRYRLFTALYFLAILLDGWTCWQNHKRIGHQHKTEDSTGQGMGTEQNREAVDIFGKKWIPCFSRNGKFPLFERQQKCHHLDNGTSYRLLVFVFYLDEHSTDFHCNVCASSLHIFWSILATASNRKIHLDALMNY